MNQHIDPATVATPAPAPERRFRIDWRIDINASSPREAAFLAREIQEQPENTATVYSVEDKQTGEIHVIDTALDDKLGQNKAARRPEDTAFVPRTLRQGTKYQTRNGFPVQILIWDRAGDYPLGVTIDFGEGRLAPGVRTKAGLHPAGGGKPHPLDVVEANPTIVKWVRLYDRKLNENGKQVVGGKEFAAERGLFMYLFDTEAEARASLQGVRAVFPIEYREGEGLG